MDWNNFFRSNIASLVPYAPGLREEEVRSIAKTDVIHKLSSNENPYPPFASALEAMAAELVHLNSYSDGSAHALRQKLADRYQVPMEQITVGNGSNELLDLIGEACLEPGDEVVFGWPSFVVYKSLAQINGATARPIPLTGDRVFDLAAMKAAINEKTKLVFLCNPNNPTGTVVSVDDFEDFVESMPEHVLLVIDEAYIEYAVPGSTGDSLKYFDGKRPLVILRTFSKIYSMAGARCGYGLAPVEVVQAIDKVREPFNVNSVAQAGACASLDGDEELIRRRKENNENKEILYACFEELGIKYVKSYANFIWIEVEHATDVFDKLLQRGVIIRNFGSGDALRVGVGSLEATLATVEAFREIFA